ncbi:MAG: cytochrome c biogenesis protein CcsA [Deltaproteobacteria bacterium]|nr:cytochrome c biogenesis protein CcsA [Deltaproteobacteria bacterium]MBI4224372.1 cytochrome c biogenesis protein CcsA [Deltaproteobacteria bacterium]
MKFLWIIIVAGFFAFAQYWGLFHTPPDALMGEVQKLMYVHVPAAWNSFISFFVVFAASILFLIRKKMFWDHLAAAAAEVGCVLTALTLCLGSIWGRPTWGVWWTWDPRLTTTAILFFLYVGYLALRGFVDDNDRRARLSAPLGILIFLNVPIVYMSVKWWRTLHQVQSSPETVAPEMALSLRLNAIAFLLIALSFIYYRFQLQQRREKWELEKIS